jgi:hypothetical protein
LPVSKVRDLGVIIDEELTITAHVNQVFSECFYQLLQLRSIRRSLPLDAGRALVTAFISSQLDYCCAILYGVAAGNIHRLQIVMNAAARLVTNTGRYTSTSHQYFAIFYTGCQSNSGSSSRSLCSPSIASVVLVLATSMASAHHWQTFLGVPTCKLLIVVTFLCRQLRRRLVVEVSGLQRLLYGTHFPFICATELSANGYLDRG